MLPSGDEIEAEAGVGRGIEHELNIGDLRRVHRFGGEGRRSESAGDDAVAQGSCRGGRFCSKIFRRRDFPWRLFLADQLALGIGALPGDQFERLRQRAGGGGLDRYRAAAHDTQPLGFDL